ncbi:DUF1810 domain-containing protein [Mesorhizobium sp. B2-6-5]|uniref:DUF1810 domain-containing protein n=1 Tax=Mesorhizobium sp. B2-6-5 TaxID=2589912 RepID=UPI001126C0AD|nr:DUF1810 domain-containing protein [Mesorhizobium sp. B2-6-5]TPJ40027.1 DUF1810 domain-containing protein [Mesorhizobium sp. B2-6-5]
MAFDDPYDLARFRAAQEPVFEAALAELRAGRKHSHWMWFVFPQLRGLGHSPNAQYYGISSKDEARAYLADAVLGERLHHATAAALGVNGRSAHEIFGSPDDVKFCSSMTLFGETAGVDGSIFREALGRFFGGERDQRTLDLL